MIFYTDGSAHPNPGPGGYGVVGIEDGKVKYAHSEQYSYAVTNNEMELKAIFHVMYYYGIQNEDWDQPPVVYSDSAYCVNTLNEWMFNWAKNNWIKSNKKIPENIDVIQAYYLLYKKGHRIDLRKIKGHNGHQWNELADKLATGKISNEEVMRIYG